MARTMKKTPKKKVRKKAKVKRGITPEQAHKATLWKKGQSGNPSGLSKGKRDLIENVRKKLLGDGDANLDAACKRLIELIHSDDERVAAAAIKEYFDRVLGKAPQAITGMGGGPVRLDFGKLTDDELRQAHALMGKAGLDGSISSTA